MTSNFTLPGIVKSTSSIAQNEEEQTPPRKSFKFGQVDQGMLMSRLYSTPFNKASTNQRYVLDMGSTSMHKPRIKKLENPAAAAEPVVSPKIFCFFSNKLNHELSLLTYSIGYFHIVNTMLQKQYRSGIRSS